MPFPFIGITILQSLVALVGLLSTIITLDWFVHRGRVQYLKNVKPIPLDLLPTVSIIFSARDEGENVGQACYSHLHQNYPSYNVIGLDDRSTDLTGAVLQNLAMSNPHMKVISIKKCPEKWLGKNHALWKGAMDCDSEWILFTDADVKFHVDTLTQALSYAKTNQVDHLVVYPELESTGFLEKVMMACFMFAMSLHARPWKLRDPKAKDAMGIGAFNLIRREVYEKIGTHKSFSLSVVDDVQLARRVKRNGFKLDGLLGQDRVRVRWQKDLWGMVQGLEKNLFAGFEFSRFMVWLSIVVFMVLTWVPLLGGFLLNGPWKWFAWGELGLYLFLFLMTHDYHQAPFYGFPFLPGGMMLFCYAMLKSMRITLKQGGIKWRDNFYPLSLFKKPSWKNIWKLLTRDYD